MPKVNIYRVNVYSQSVFRLHRVTTILYSFHNNKGLYSVQELSNETRKLFNKFTEISHSVAPSDDFRFPRHVFHFPSRPVKGAIFITFEYEFVLNHRK